MISLLMATAAMSAVPIEVASVDGANIQTPVWSPNGTFLSFEANHHEKRYIELYVGTPFVGDFKKVSPPTTTSAFGSGFAKSASLSVTHELSWSPDSAQFCYTAVNDSGDADIYLSSGVIAVDGPNTDDSPAWSPDGHHILFTSSRSGMGDLFMTDLKGAIKAIPSRPDGSELSPAWSPDSTRFAWVRHGDSGDEIVVASLNNTQPVPVYDNDNDQLRPTFSPNSEFVAFYTSAPQSARFDLVVASLTSAPSPGIVAHNVRVNTNGPVWLKNNADILTVINDDTRYDPIVKVNIVHKRQTLIRTDTINNRDISLTYNQNGPQLAIVAQGKTTDNRRDFMRLFVVTISGAIQ